MMSTQINFEAKLEQDDVVLFIDDIEVYRWDSTGHFIEGRYDIRRFVASKFTELFEKIG